MNKNKDAIANVLARRVWDSRGRPTIEVEVHLAGGASGRMKTGYHIAGDNSPVSRVGLTLQKALGVSVDSWGQESLQVRTPYTELLA